MRKGFLSEAKVTFSFCHEGVRELVVHGFHMGEAGNAFDVDSNPKFLAHLKTGSCCLLVTSNSGQRT
jgi:hypothetical protein